ncbi:hypothetical protein [Cystobacter ferrugineus]|uniref:Uncharacterized protein n=1 Tax=Cystobacter ferrugineus TaxID=83449 RepID=A0A1L9AYJ7_9BACT|nr:hypothetical protein [Cystobacter ferrugineus]OJH35082.1 hypothetical protein BON30_39090 [Cystobacter ferrugineus]
MRIGLTLLCMPAQNPVVLWSYAHLEESADSAAAPSPAATSYLPGEFLPDPRHELHLDAEGVAFGPGEDVRYPSLPERVRLLSTCAEDGPSQRAERCLAHLAALDRPAAVEIARTWSRMELPEGAEPLVAALLNFPAAGALESFLDGLGMTDQLHLELREHEERPVTLRDVLLLRGRAHLFSLKRRQDGVRHDVLMRELASLAGGALDGLHLEQVPPAEEALDGEDLDEAQREEQEGEDAFREYAAAEQLVARGGGKCYEASAKGEVSVDEDDDYIDAYVLLDFLNALAHARGSGVRWVLFDTDGESCVVVAGPAAALEALQARGLIPETSPERLAALAARFGHEF